MLSAVIFATLCAMTAARNIDLNHYTFDQFVKDFKLRYQPHEIEGRRASFLAELARVRAHNAKNLSWKETINKFSAMTPAEKKAFKGRNKGAAKSQSKMLKSSKELPADFQLKPVSVLPKEVDWRTKGKFSVAEIFFEISFVSILHLSWF
jgi:di/tripeptidase